MGEHLLKYIRGEIDKLNDEQNRCKTLFKEEYPMQNRGLYDEQILDWIKRMSPNNKFIYIVCKSSLYEVNTNKSNQVMLISLNKRHLYAMYANGGILENYDTSNWQKTSNNCTLYAGIVAIVRPLVSSMSEMFNILKLIDDTEGSKSCEKLASISKYYFGRGLEMFRFCKSPPKLLHIKHECNRTLYIHFHGLNPYGALYCESNTRFFKQMKGVDFRLYMRTMNEPQKEIHNFINWFNIMKRHYVKFVLMGHSYGSVFANYFAQYLIDNDDELNVNNVISVSLDGSELIDTCEWAAYELLGIDRKHKIEYGEYTATCNGRDIVKEFNEIDRKRFEKEFGVNLIECDAITWYCSVKTCHEFKHKHICFGFSPNKENPDKVKVVHDKPEHYEVYYLNKYDHALFMFEPVAKSIMDIIDGYICE